MIAITPSGTRVRVICRPFGRFQPSSTSPTGSASPATVRSPFAMPLRRESVSRRQVGVVGRLDLGRPLQQQVGGGQERGVLGVGRGRGEQAAGGLGPLTQL